MAYFHTNVLDPQIKALPTVGEASGSVASFDTDMTEDLIEVVCDIQYTQASGTPSPDNPLPITTFSEMNVYAMGKNLFYNDLLSGAYSDANFTISSTSTTQRSIKIWLPAGTYTISFGGGDNYRIIRRLFDGGYDAQHVTNITEYTFTTTIDGYVGLSFRREDNSDWQDINIQIEQYGNKYNIPFGQTVAKGTLNVITGVLEITHFSYSDIWENGTNASVRGDYTRKTFAFASPTYCKYPATDDYQQKCDIAPYKVQYNEDSLHFYCNNSNVVLFLPNDTVGTQAFTVVAELNEVQTIQLSATQITALLNENNVWCDTNGDTSVKYILSVGKAIS